MKALEMKLKGSQRSDLGHKRVKAVEEKSPVTALGDSSALEKRGAMAKSSP